MKRYRLAYGKNREHPDGGWVRWEDAERLQGIVDNLVQLDGPIHDARKTLAQASGLILRYQNPDATAGKLLARMKDADTPRDPDDGTEATHG